jgi:hypothetical protein
MQNVTRTEDGITLNIAVNEVFAGVKVTSITMHVGVECDDDYWGDSDLAVNWDASTLQNTGGGDMGTLIMRGDDDEVGEVMGEFYWEHGFNKRLHEILIANGFTAAAANDVTGSEWGMQDEGRASYDACAIADEIRAAFNITATEEA